MTRRWYGAIMITLAAPVAGAQVSDAFASAVRELLAPREETIARPVEQAAVARIYSRSDTRPLWTLRASRPTAQASAAIGALASAESHGLVSEDYDVTALWELAYTAEVSPTDAARFAVRCSADSLDDVALERALGLAAESMNPR